MNTQFQLYLKILDRDLTDLELNPNFEDGVGSLYRDANVLVLLALAIGLSPEDSELKAAAPALVAAAQEVAQVTDLGSAKKSVEALRAACSAQGDASQLTWTKLAHLSPLMKKGLPNLTTEIKRLARNEKTLERSGNLEKVVGDAATLAVIALGVRPNVEETLSPNEDELWAQYCDQLYTASYKMYQASKALQSTEGKFDDFSAAFKEVDATCNTTCHEKFGGSSR